MSRHTTWVATFDGASARIYALDRDARKLVSVEGLTLEGPHRASFVERPTRVQDGATGTRSAVEQTTDAERALEDDFVRGLVARLDQRRANFHRLVVAASPRALGAFRAAASPDLMAQVSDELSRNYVNTPPHELIDQLAEVLRL